VRKELGGQGGELGLVVGRNKGMETGRAMDHGRKKIGVLVRAKARKGEQKGARKRKARKI
jgi:hypothetical protein